jgi:sugar/nucleoside kinase (ribokinase family)
MTRQRDIRLDLLVLGDLNPDLLVIDDDPVPRFGQEERVVRSISLAIGGSGAIVACGAARLGLVTALHAVIGNDALGRLMLSAVAERGVDTRACVLDRARPTGASVILSSAADRAILTAMGAIDAATHIPLDLIRRARHVHVTSWFLRRSMSEELLWALAEAHASGATTSIDPNWDPAQCWDGGIADALAESDVVFVNEREAICLTGESSVERAADTLGLLPAGGSRQPPVIVVKRGSDGALALGHGERLAFGTLPVDVVDTTGCGDSFDAGFLHGFIGARTLPDCLRLGIACGSLAARAPGGTASQPTIDEALDASQGLTERPLQTERT